MTFAAIEVSRDSGRPVELLQITTSNTQWLYTTAEVPIVFNTNTYTPLPMMRAQLQPTGDAAKSNLNIQLPKDTPVGDLFRIQPPSEIVSVTIFAEHYLDNDFQTVWKGRIINIEWDGPWLTLTTESIFSSLQRVGLRRRYSVQCPYALYSGECGVARETYKQTYSVASISGSTIVCAGAIGKPDNYFAGGYVSWFNSARNTLDQRMVKSSVGSTGALVLASVPFGLSVAQSVSAYPGCDHSLTTCASKFANSFNYGGMPFIPSKNPFGGSTIY